MVSAAPAATLRTTGVRPGRAVARRDDGGRAGGIGGAQAGAEIVRIGDAVEHQHERRRLRCAVSRSSSAFSLSGALGRTSASDALVRGAAGFLVERGHRQRATVDAPARRELAQFAHALVVAAPARCRAAARLAAGARAARARHAGRRRSSRRSSRAAGPCAGAPARMKMRRRSSRRARSRSCARRNRRAPAARASRRRSRTGAWCARRPACGPSRGSGSSPRGSEVTCTSPSTCICLSCTNTPKSVTPVATASNSSPMRGRMYSHLSQATTERAASSARRSRIEHSCPSVSISRGEWIEIRGGAARERVADAAMHEQVRIAADRRGEVRVLLEREAEVADVQSAGTAPAAASG